MAKLSTSSVFGDLLVDGTIFGNVTGNLTGNASTATSATTATSAGKWTTARTITIGSKGKSVDGSGNVSWTLAEIGAAESGHKHGLLHDNLTCTLENTTTDNGWSMINSSYGGFLLKSIRTNATAPNWICNDYSAGIAFGGADTKGVISTAYSSPSIKFAGGNGTKPVWWIGLTGTTGTSYNLANFENKNHGTHVTWSTTTPKANGTAAVGTETKVARGDHVHPLQTSVSGNAGTATKLATAREIKIGNTGKNFDGSANVSWTLSEIGAAASSHTHSVVSKTIITPTIYNPSTGVLVDFNLNVKSGVMAIIKLYGNSYSANPPIEAIYQFYDYASGDIQNCTGSAISGPPITLKVYKADGKLKAWFQQPSNYCTFKLEVAYGNNSSTPNVTLSNAAEPATNITQTVTITPNRVYSAAYKPTAADIGAAPSTHSHNYLPLAGGVMTGAIKRSSHVGTWVAAMTNSMVTSTAGTAGTFQPMLSGKTTNGSMCLAYYQGTLQGAYITKANVDAGTNTTSKTVTLMDESGNGGWSGSVTAAGGFVSGSTMRSDTALTDDLGTTSIPWRNTYADTYYIYGEASKNYGSLCAQTTGTTSATGEARLTLGNSTATGTASNAYGRIIMYGTSSGYTLLTPGNNSTSNVTVTLPSGAGTLARTADNVASATKLATARTLTIGRTGKTFDGSANQSWSLAEIGAAAESHTHSYLPLTGGTITGELLLKKGSRVHTAEGTSGTSGYVFIAQITFTGNYQNQPIYMQIAQRGRDLSTLEMRFSSINSTDPALSVFNKTGGVEAYLYKSATSTWDLFIKKSEAYDKIDIVDFKKGQYMQYTNVTWANTLYEAVPTGSVAAQSGKANLTAVNSDFANATISNYDTVMNGINTNISNLN